MGGNEQNIQESTDSMMKAFRDNLPGVLTALNAQVGPTAEAQYAADAAVSPKYTDLQTKLYEDYAPRLNKVGQDMQAANDLASSQSELALAQGPGKELVSVADQVQRQLDPEAYKARESVGSGLSKLLSSMDPTQLSGSERAEIARSMPGIANNNSAMDTINNAMTFGSALADKQSRYGNAIAQAASAIPSLQSGISGFEVATRRATTPNSGDTRFQGNTTGSGGNAFSTGNNFLSQVGSNNNQIINKQQSTLQNVLGASGIGNSIIGGASKIAGMI